MKLTAYLGLIAMAPVLVATGCTEEPATLEWTPYAKVGNWTVLRYTETGKPTKTHSCSAVTENIRKTSLRIATNGNAYTVGINGGSPTSESSKGDMKAYIDGNVANTIDLKGSFLDDPAYELDHWLSATFSGTSPHLLTMMDGHTDTVATYNPGNRTGNDWPESHFELYDGNELRNVLDTCMAAEEPPAPIITKKFAAGTCGTETPLPASGMCPATARTLMHLAKGTSDDFTPEGCTWDVNDAALPDKSVLIYRSMKCGPDKSALIASNDTAPFTLKAETSVIPPNVPADVGFETKDGWKENVVTVFNIGPDSSPYNEIPKIAQTAAKTANMPYNSKCALEWDEFAKLDTINGPVDMESEHWFAPCGPMGATEGYGAYWNYLQPGYVAFINYPSDGLFGIQWNTLTRVERNENGDWDQR